MYKTKIKNPVLRGFNPDPNILKVGEKYYIAVSSFEWLPGIRVYESDDLVNWQHYTDILTNQVDLKGNPRGASIWAPQLSYHDGLYYCILTNVRSTNRPFKDCHNYLVTAKDMKGPWSEAIYLNSSGFDPSLFHDDVTGKKWLVNEIWDYRMKTGNKSCGIVLQEFDSKENTLVGEVYKIFDGTELAKTEAPHLYYHDDYYYLITAEGGTGKDHSVTILRSKNITGPYELDPQYPMLTASDKPESPLQCSGHASLVKGEGNHWYIAYLTTRPIENKAAILGRETAIQEVYWTEDGWLRLVSGGNGPQEDTIIYTKEKVSQVKNTNFKEDFSNGLQSEWNSLRQLPDSSWCDFTSKEKCLRLHSGESLQSMFDQHLLAIRQKDKVYEVETTFEFEPKHFNEMAGLALFLDTENYIYAYMTYDEEHEKVLRLIKSVHGEYELSELITPIHSSKISLKFKANQGTGQFYYKDETSDWKTLDKEQDLMFLSGGYTGNFIGITVIDLNKQMGSYADYFAFSYQGLDSCNLNNLLKKDS